MNLLPLFMAMVAVEVPVGPGFAIGWSMASTISYGAENGRPVTQIVPTDGWAVVPIAFTSCGEPAAELLDTVSVQVVDTETGENVGVGALEVLEASPPTEGYPVPATLRLAASTAWPPDRSLRAEVTVQNALLGDRAACGSPTADYQESIPFYTTGGPSEGPKNPTVEVTATWGFTTTCPSVALSVGVTFNDDDDAEWNHSLWRFLRVEASGALTQAFAMQTGAWWWQPSAEVGFPKKQDRYCVIVDTESLLNGKLVRGEQQCIDHQDLPEDIRSTVDEPCAPAIPLPMPLPGDRGCSAGGAGSRGLVSMALGFFLLNLLVARQRRC
jgi:hypothetical protein